MATASGMALMASISCNVACNVTLNRLCNVILLYVNLFSTFSYHGHYDYFRWLAPGFVLLFSNSILDMGCALAASFRRQSFSKGASKGGQ